MKVTEIEHIERKERAKAEIIELLEKNNIPYQLKKCCGCERICIVFGENATDKENCYNSAINILTSNKDACRIYTQNILYIAIENRKSVLYMTDRKIETNYPIDYWINILDKKVFAQPHYSYIVNLNYVDEVTKYFVKIKYGDEEYSVYTSLRKISRFKKAFLNFK